jgi:hypothetical protein
VLLANNSDGVAVIVDDKRGAPVVVVADEKDGSIVAEAAPEVDIMEDVMVVAAVEVVKP